MSEGTAQGIPRPLQVLKATMEFEHPEFSDNVVSALIEDAVRFIARNGYIHRLPNETNVLYPPDTIYKITYKELEWFDYVRWPKPNPTV